MKVCIIFAVHYVDNPGLTFGLVFKMTKSVSWQSDEDVQQQMWLFKRPKSLAPILLARLAERQEKIRRTQAAAKSYAFHVNAKRNLLEKFYLRILFLVPNVFSHLRFCIKNVPEEVNEPLSATSTNIATTGTENIHIYLPFHSQFNFNFPKKPQGNQIRYCQARWWLSFRWLHYFKERDVILCFTCVMQNEKRNTEWL